MIMSSGGYSNNNLETLNRYSNTHLRNAGGGAATPVAVPVLWLR